MTLKEIRNGKLIQFSILLAFLLLNSYLLIGDSEIRLATSTGDESPINYAYYMKFPERFVNDVSMKHKYFTGISALQNWSTALLFTHLNFNPEILSILWVYTQNILLGFAIFKFAKNVTKSQEIAWLSVVFIMAFRPHWWNLMLHADLDFRATSQHLALPFLIYAASFLLEEKLYPTIICIAAGGLFHPTFSALMIPMAGIYWIFTSSKKWLTKELIWRGILFRPS